MVDNSKEASAHLSLSRGFFCSLVSLAENMDTGTAIEMMVSSGTPARAVEVICRWYEEIGPSISMSRAGGCSRFLSLWRKEWFSTLEKQLA
jgi:hypothetical protein